MNNSPICKRLKEARQVAKLSQKKLGIDGFSASARMNHYEKGRHTPDFATLQRMASVLKLPTAYFYAESDELVEMIRCFHRLRKMNRSAILKELAKYYSKQ